MMDSQAVAKFLGINRQTVRKIVQKNILRPQQQIGNSNIFDPADVDALKRSSYRDGLTHTQIARMYGKTRNTVIYWLRELGVKPDGRDGRRHRAPSVYDPETVRHVAARLGWEVVEPDPAPED